MSDHINMSQSESVNVDVDSVSHNSEPTTVETRVSISSAEMSVSNSVENSSIEVNSPVPLDHEDSVLDEVRSEEKLVIPVTTQESTAVPLPVELVIPATTQESEIPLPVELVIPATTQESEIPLPEKLVIPAIPHNSDNSARDDMEPEERLPVPGVDNSNVMVYPPLNSKTNLSSGFSQEFSVPEAPPPFSGQQLPPSGWQPPFPPGQQLPPPGWQQPSPPVWSQSAPAGYGYPPPGYQVQALYDPRYGPMPNPPGYYYPSPGYQPAPMLQAPPPDWQYQLPPPGYAHQYGAPVFQPAPAVKSNPILNVPVQQVHTVVTTRSKAQQRTRRSGTAPVIQQSATPAVAQTPSTPSVEQPAISAVAQIPSSPSDEEYQSSDNAPIAIKQEGQGMVSGMVSDVVSSPASMSTVAPVLMASNSNDNPDDDDDDNNSINSSKDENANNAEKIQSAGAGNPDDGDNGGDDDEDNNDDDSFNDSSDDNAENDNNLNGNDNDNGDNGSPNSTANHGLASTPYSNEYTSSQFRPQMAQKVITMPLPNLTLKPAKISFEIIANWYESVFNYHQEFQDVSEPGNIVAGAYITNNDTVNRIQVDYLQVFKNCHLHEDEINEGQISRSRFRNLTLSELCQTLAFPLYTEAADPVGTFVEELKKIKLENSEPSSLRALCKSLRNILRHFLKIFKLQVPVNVMSSEITKIVKLIKSKDSAEFWASKMDAFLRQNKYLAQNLPYNIRQSFWHYLLVLEKVLVDQEKSVKLWSATPRVSKSPDKSGLDKSVKKEKKRLAAISKAAKQAEIEENATKLAAIEEKKKKKKDKSGKPIGEKSPTCFDCGKKGVRKHHENCPCPDEPNEKGNAAFQAFLDKREGVKKVSSSDKARVSRINPSKRPIPVKAIWTAVTNNKVVCNTNTFACLEVFESSVETWNTLPTVNKVSTYHKPHIYKSWGSESESDSDSDSDSDFDADLTSDSSDVDDLPVTLQSNDRGIHQVENDPHPNVAAASKFEFEIEIKLLDTICCYKTLFDTGASDGNWIPHELVEELSLKKLATHAKEYQSPLFGDTITSDSGVFMSFRIPALNDLTLSNIFFRILPESSENPSPIIIGAEAIVDKGILQFLSNPDLTDIPKAELAEEDSPEYHHERSKLNMGNILVAEEPMLNNEKELMNLQVFKDQVNPKLPRKGRMNFARTLLDYKDSVFITQFTPDSKPVKCEPFNIELRENKPFEGAPYRPVIGRLEATSMRSLHAANSASTSILTSTSTEVGF